MTDKRILKTKMCLKNSLMELAGEKPFDKITVKEICERASTGRVTFYTYYKDKFDLVKDCFEDTKAEIQRRTREKNDILEEPDPKECFNNLLDSVIDTMEQYESVEDNLLCNPDFIFMYYQFIEANLKEFEAELGDNIQTDFDCEQLHAFITLGLWGFIHAKPDRDPKETRADAKKLLEALMDSSILTMKRG